MSHPEQLAFLNTSAYKQEFPITSYPNYIDYRDRSTVFTRIAAIVLGAFGLLAIVLAYGIMAYAVARRRREIGIRMALGAKPSQVVRVALSRAGILLAIGMTAGIALSIASGKLMAALLFGVSALDPVTYGIAIMTAVALAAAWFPVRRAISIDPVTALRSE